MLQVLLGRRIAELRIQRDLTQEKLAERAGYSVEFISLVERGLNAPSVAGLERIAVVLGIEVKELFNFKQRKPSK